MPQIWSMKEHVDKLINKFSSNSYKNYKSMFDYLFMKKPIIVIIGAMDGKTNDPILKTVIRTNVEWSGLAIEPEPTSYLKLNYYLRNKMIKAINCAIGIDNEIKEFYAADEKQIMKLGLPEYLLLCSSFLETSEIKKYPEAFTKIKINTKSVKNLLQENNISHIDYLQIDVEGYDYTVFKQFIDINILPIILRIEYKHISHSDFIELMDFIHNRYNIINIDSGDITCTIKQI